jgi:uroporphyrin-III C-methyltransferase / precorrin-2 dehydrogenase / sirohydrochlorin ferrochelatase
VTPVYPVFLRLEGKLVVLVGGGRVAAQKLPGLLSAGARVTVVAPAIDAAFERPEVTRVRREFRAEDLEGARWVVAAAPPSVNAEVAAAAEARNLFVNAVDDPARASAYLGGVVRKGGVTLSISTAGAAPALAGLLREALEAILPDDVERWLEVARDLRQHWKIDGTPMEARRAKLLEVLRS